MNLIMAVCIVKNNLLVLTSLQPFVAICWPPPLILQLFHPGFLRSHLGCFCANDQVPCSLANILIYYIVWLISYSSLEAEATNLVVRGLIKLHSHYINITILFG